MLTRSDVEAMLALADPEASPDRDEVLALLRERRGTAPTDATIPDLIATARAHLAWAQAEQMLDVEFEPDKPDQEPIVPRPVRGEILSPDRLVPGLEAHFTFETLDNVRADRVPRVSIKWYASDTTGHIVGKPDITDYNEGQPHSALNERIFEVTFDKPGAYVIHAFVNHNFFVSSYIKSEVTVTTEAAILEEFRERAEPGWGAEEQPTTYEFADIARDEELFATLVALGLGGLLGLGIPLPDTGYAMGTRAEGELTEEAVGEFLRTFENRRAQLQAELARLDRLIIEYGRGDDENAREIVTFIKDRRGRVQAAIAQLSDLIEADALVNPVPVRAFFASRTHGIPSAPLTLVAYFTYEGEGADLRYRGHLLDQSELLESRHYDFDAEKATFEAMMEALFLQLTMRYPNGTVSLAFQLYDGGGSTNRFMRLERVTDTYEQDIRELVFSNAANIAVNLVATLLVVFPPTAMGGLALAITYNAAALADEIRQDLRSGTLSAEKTALQMSQLALDIIPFVGRATRLVTLSERAYRVIEATQLAGQVYLLTEDAELAIQNLRDTQITELTELQDRIRRIEAVNASDSELDELHRHEAELIDRVSTAGREVYEDLLASQALTIASEAVVRRAAEPFVTGRGAGGQPETEPSQRTSRPTMPESELLDRPEHILASARTLDGAHEIHIWRDGQILRCSRNCTQIRAHFEELLSELVNRPRKDGDHEAEAAEAFMKRLNTLEESETAIRAKQATAEPGAQPDPALAQEAEAVAKAVASLESDVRQFAAVHLAPTLGVYPGSLSNLLTVLSPTEATAAGPRFGPQRLGHLGDLRPEIIGHFWEVWSAADTEAQDHLLAILTHNMENPRRFTAEQFDQVFKELTSLQSDFAAPLPADTYSGLRAHITKSRVPQALNHLRTTRETLSRLPTTEATPGTTEATPTREATALASEEAPPRQVADPAEIDQGIRRVRDLLSEPEVRAARRDNRSFDSELQRQLRNQEGRALEEQLDAARTEADTARELGDPDFISEAQQRLDALQAQVESLEAKLRRITEGDLPGEPIVEGPFANEPPGRAAERARVEQSPETRANFRRQLAPGDIEGAPAAEGGTGQTGHGRSKHGWSNQMQSELLNNPDRVFTGLNKEGNPVDVYYRNNGDVAITVAGKKEQVITAYGPSDPDGTGTFNAVSKWADDPSYVEINPRNGRPIPPAGG